MNVTIDRAATEAALREMLRTNRFCSGRIGSPDYCAAVSLAAIGIPPNFIVGIDDAITVAGFDTFLADVDRMATSGGQFDCPAERAAYLSVPAANRADFRAALKARLDGGDDRQAAWLAAALAAVPGK